MIFMEVGKSFGMLQTYRLWQLMVNNLTLSSDLWQQQTILQLVDTKMEPSQIQIHFPGGT